MNDNGTRVQHNPARDKFISRSLQSTRKSYYLQLKNQLEQAKDNEYKLQLLIDNLPARISYINRKEEFILANKTYEQDFELPLNTIIGQPIATVVGPENYKRIKPYFERVLSGEHVAFETPFIEMDGTERWLEINYIPVMDETGEVKGFYGLVLDLTEKKEAEKKQKELKEKLNDAQKMQAIGTLAGGLAHDFNNLMMGMLGRASLMLAQMDPSDPMAEHVRSIEEYVGSAVHLTQQLLGFARGGKYEVQPTAINELLDNSALLFARTNKNIRIHGDYHENNPIVQIDRKQIEQVLLNMFVNAKQAMEEGGNIYLETNIVFLDDIFCKPYEISSGSYIRIIISDDGCGMTEIVRRQVFDPFFTTKEKQRGTGLGLASAYGIIKNHNGIITVYSEQGSGSSFHIYLPHSKQSSALDKKRENKPEIIEGFENILLVDDENLILEVGQALLKSLGYTVMLAQSGQQALDILNDKKGEIDLVILDLVMPEMNGAETFKKIRKQYPNIRVLLSSGYSINGQAQQVMDQGCDGFIQKPFSLAELSQVTKNVLIR